MNLLGYVHIARVGSLTDDLFEGIYIRPFLILSCFATDLACNFAKYNVNRGSISSDTTGLEMDRDGSRCHHDPKAVPY